MGRRLRIGLLMVLLGSSILLLWYEPHDDLLTEAHWKRLGPAPDGPGCGEIPGERTWWMVSVTRPGAEEAFAGLPQAVLRPIGPTCAHDCLVVHEVTLEPSWIDEPGFFSGLATFAVRMQLTRRGARSQDGGEAAPRGPSPASGPGTALPVGCQEHHVYQLRAIVDQGRRGDPLVVTRTLGWMIGGFLCEKWG
ncbi:MAG: hypothetical protein FJ125_18255, partial [Deltaproteobacteria bacterium]|nr:hypothetical protein [Deltaproteobacteria bacterium]